MDDKWDLLITEFRRFGGIADNICIKEGEYGRGIFPANPSLRARIFTPSKLFIKQDDIYLEDDHLRIKKDKVYDQEIKNFFYFYQDNFSWGFGGKETTELFEKGLILFRQNLKEIIKKNILVDLDDRHKGEWKNVIKKQFLSARAIKLRDSSIIAPIWELVNHKAKSFPFILSEKGVSTPNYPPIDIEIMHTYSNSSSIQRFFSYGFYSEESIVFSFPFSIHVKNLGMFIDCKGMCLNDDSMKIERSNNKIILEGLPIADINHPRLPYNYFDEILRRTGITSIPKDLLFRIFQFNISIRKNIINESELIDNQVSKTFIQVMAYEISLISVHDSN